MRDDPSELYPCLLGDAWRSLDESVRRLHLRSTRACRSGAFRVERGRSPGARLCGWLIRLPEAGERVPIELTIVATPRGDRWRRCFGGSVLETLQYRRGAGVLAERWGPIECRFALGAQEGALVYRQIGAWLRLGALCLRLPRSIAPRVIGVARGLSLERVQIDVAIGVPLLGPLIEYSGEVRITPREEAAA